MASTGQKWAMGCGIGCLLVIVILGGIGTCSYIGIKRIEEKAEGLEAQRDALDERFGPAESWSPPADGVVDPASIEVFLAAREDLRERGADVNALLDTLEGDAGPLDKARSGFTLIPTIIEYIGNHSAVLLEHDMHPGEHSYLYAVVYYSWLGHDPGDGPAFRIDGDRKDDQGFRWRAEGSGDDARADRAREARRTLNRLMMAWLGNQQDALMSAGETDSEWARTLGAELAALRDDPERIAWEGGLPESIESSLVPYRDRLENAYSERLNALEVALLDHDDDR